MKKFSFLALAGLMLGLASCSTDAPDSGKVLENETQTFVKISLVSTDGSGSRAQDGEFDDDLFENGLESENEIKKLLLVFYDGGGTYVGNTEITVTGDYENGNDDLTISRVLTTVAEVHLPENTNHPAYVVAFANPTSAYKNLLNLEKLTDLPKELRKANTMSNAGMTMNNSVYYDEVLGQPVYATPVNFTTQFYKTEDEARANPGVEITIERVQAKVKVGSLADIDVTEFKSNEQGDYTLEFVPENWFVNATEKQTFLLKNFRGNNQNYHISNLTADFSTSMSFSDLQGRFTTEDNRANQLNEQRRKRSYWALSPTYFFEGSDNYPSISYDVKYVSQSNGTINSAANEYCLSYVSYNDGVKSGVVNGVRRAYDYCLENTMNLATLKSDRAKAAMTSVVLLGHYVIKNKAGETVFDGASDTGTFYIRHDSSTSKVVLLTENDVKDYFLERTGNLIYVKVPAENDPTVFEYQPLRAAHVKAGYASYDDFELEHPKKISAAILGQSVVSEQWRTLKFKNNTTNLDKYYVYGIKDGSYQYISLKEYGVANLLVNMYSAYGLVESFKNGKAFFNVPLKHIYYNAALYDHKNANSNEFVADKVQLGDYGVVRNHVYDLTINRITGLGSGIGDLNQPIVPPTEVDRYYISAKLNILKWRIVGQSVDL